MSKKHEEKQEDKDELVGESLPLLRTTRPDESKEKDSDE